MITEQGLLFQERDVIALELSDKKTHKELVKMCCNLAKKKKQRYYNYYIFRTWNKKDLIDYIIKNL